MKTTHICDIISWLGGRSYSLQGTSWQNKHNNQPQYTVGCAMAQVASWWSVIAVAGLWSRATPCKICGTQRGTGTRFAHHTSIFPCQYHSTNVPYSYLHLNTAFIRRTRDQRLETSKQSSVIPDTEQRWTGKYVDVVLMDSKARRLRDIDYDWL